MKAVNLIPGEQRQGAGSYTGRSGGGALIVLGMLAGLAVLVALYGSAHHQISSQAGQVASLDAQTSAVEVRTGALAPYTSFVTIADQRTATVSQLVQARFDWSHVLHELGRVLPAGTALSTLHGAVGSTTGSGSSAPASAAGATPASSTPPGSTPVFTLTGCAKGQSVVAQTLQRLRLMDGASEVQLQSSTKSGATSGASGSGGGCPSGTASFSVQILFTALPAAPAGSAPATGAAATTAAAAASASAQPVSAAGTGVSK
jgi:Tfp pilus assembly protein PilN